MIVRGLESSSHTPPSVVVMISVTGQERGAGLKSQALHGFCVESPSVVRSSECGSCSQALCGPILSATCGELKVSLTSLG